jgi:4-hydroxy-2-oxoheptanedioate aldolase
VLFRYIINESSSPDRRSFAYQISTAARAKEVVADTRFPPDGRRGFGSPFTPGIWDITASQYLESANENILVMIQVENKEAVENVEEIASVEGIGEQFKPLP